MSESPAAYPWWSTIKGESLAQGDLLLNLELAVPTQLPQNDNLQAKAVTIDAVIMSQTCDITQNKIDNLLLCPRWDLWTFVDEGKKAGQNWSTEIREKLLMGNIPGYHLLHEANEDGISIGLSVIDFHQVYTASLELVSEFARASGARLRLLPPYREHLAQAFARFFMRVGLPVDIPKEMVRSRPSSRTQ